MYTEGIKENLRGVMGSFMLKNGKKVESDLESDLKSIVPSILLLAEAVTKKRELQQVTFLGKKNRLSVYFWDNVILGVVLNRAGNPYLLNFVVKKLLKNSTHNVKIPPLLQDQIPYFDGSKEEILSNVPEYARQVLKYVDGNRSIQNIVQNSELPVEIVLDVILSFRRSSVLHYR
ncbi:MAG: hypothetical protein PVF58_09575 [Candidatus Methanofastidiosia archaeon]|jgi:hypothetical protein